MSLSLKAKVGVVATLAVAGIAVMAYGSHVPTLKERRGHEVEVTVAFAPSPRVTENEYVTVHLTVNNHGDPPLPVNESPWKVAFPAETGDVVSVTGRQRTAVGTVSCRIKVDGVQRDHEITKPDESHAMCLVVL